MGGRGEDREDDSEPVCLQMGSLRCILGKYKGCGLIGLYLESEKDCWRTWQGAGVCGSKYLFYI